MKAEIIIIQFLLHSGIVRAHYSFLSSLAMKTFLQILYFLFGFYFQVAFNLFFALFTLQ